MAKGDTGEVEIRGVTAQDEDTTSSCQRVLEVRATRAAAAPADQGLNAGPSPTDIGEELIVGASGTRKDVVDVAPDLVR